MVPSSEVLYDAIAGDDDLLVEKIIESAGSEAKGFVNSGDERFGSPLLFAISQPTPNKELIRKLLEAGADPNFSSKALEQYCESHPLFRAAAHLDLELIQLLVAFGGDLNTVLSDEYMIGDTVARSAESDPDRAIEIFTYLKEQGVNLDHTSSYGESVVRLLAHKGGVKVLKHLNSLGVNLEPLEWPPLHRAVAFEPLNVVWSEINKAEDLNIQDSWSHSAFLFAIRIGDLQKAKALAEAGADVVLGDHCGNLAPHIAAEEDHLDLIEWLESIGADLSVSNEFGHTPIMTATEHDSLQVAEFLLKRGLHRIPGVPDPEAQAEQRKAMQEHMKSFSRDNFPDIPEEVWAFVKNPDSDLFDLPWDDGAKDLEEELVRLVSSREMMALLEKYGVSLSLMGQEQQLALLGIDENTFSRIPLPTKAEFDAGRRRKFGKTNPEEIFDPFCHYMAKSRVSAYAMKAQFESPINYHSDDPVWCNQRFGQSMTLLPDGRALFIGGEHEDGYDPDFCIYNDLLVIHPNKSYQIFAYPKEIFPPTDFHTATLVGKEIFIIGSLGYQEDRVGNAGSNPVKKLTNLFKGKPSPQPATPVWKMNTDDYSIQQVVTSGDAPGRISRHHARLLDGDNILVYGGKVSRENDEYVAYPNRSILHLPSLTWKREES